MSAVALAGTALISQAIPAIPTPVKYTQPDGTVIELLLHGDEHAHFMTSVDGSRLLERRADGQLIEAGVCDAGEQRRMMRAKAAKSPLRIVGEASAYPAHGKQKALAVLVEFPETTEHPQGRRFSYDNPRDLFDDLLNKKGFDVEGATGSVHDYFLANSGGDFDVTFDVFGPITLSQDLLFYSKKTVGSDLNAWNMALEACQQLDDQIDFHEYDRDNDGIIDNIYIFYAGEGAGTGGNTLDCIWQHAGDVETISGQKFEFDGLRLNHYACSNEYRAQGPTRRTLEGIGTVCHEFSHVLGLHDLYDVVGNGCVTPGTWSLLDTGTHLNDSKTPACISAFERMILGWIDAPELDETYRKITLGNLNDSNEAYVVRTPNENEYFVIENRQQTGWDTYTKGHGMLVWHICYDAEKWAYNEVNSDISRPGATVLLADGIIGEGSKDGDTFPGTTNSTSLTDDTTPGLRTYDGKKTYVPITSITETDGVITFDVSKVATYIPPVEGLAIKDVTTTGFTATWTESKINSATYLLDVYTMRGNDREYVCQGLGVYENHALVEGLEPDTEYFVSVATTNRVNTGEYCEAVAVRTPAMSFAYIVPEALEAVVLGGTKANLSWTAVDDANQYAITVYTKAKGAAETTVADFTDGIDVLPRGWYSNCISSMSMKGYFGLESPSLSMAASDSYIQSPVFGSQVRGLSFWYRERSASAKSSVAVEMLVDGEWTVVEEISLVERMNEGAVYTLAEDKIPAGARSVRILYNRVEKGTLAIDDIEVMFNDNVTCTAVAAWNDTPTGSRGTVATVDGLEPSTEYFFTVKGMDADGLLTLASNEVRFVTDVAGGVALPEAPVRLSIDADGNVICDTPFAIYDLSGRRLEGTRIQKRGAYIVKAGAAAVKVVY